MATKVAEKPTEPTVAKAPSTPGTGLVRTPLGSAKGAFRIDSLGDPMRKPWMNALFYGPPGGGKTTLCGSAVDIEDMQDVLLMSSDKGELVLFNNDRVEDVDLIDRIEVNTIQQVQKIYEFLQHHCRFRESGDDEALEKLQRVTFGIPDDQEVDRIRHYRTCIIDSISEVEAMNLGNILNYDESGVDAGADVEVADWPAFRKNNQIMQRLIRQFRDLPMHVLFVCAQGYVQDEIKRMHFGPSMSGKLSNQVQGFMDVVGRLVTVVSPDANAEANPRRLYVQPQTGPAADAKCRFAAYKKPFFENPTMTDIMKACGFLK